MLHESASSSSGAWTEGFLPQIHLQRLSQYTYVSRAVHTSCIVIIDGGVDECTAVFFLFVHKCRRFCGIVLFSVPRQENKVEIIVVKHANRYNLTVLNNYTSDDCNWSFQWWLDFSFPRRFVPRNETQILDVSFRGRFVPWTIRSLVVSFLGCFVPVHLYRMCINCYVLHC